jgi:pimeloyl-ACP methyl ester carboxylesterase
LKISRQTLQVGIGILLLIIGVPLARYSSSHYFQKRYVVDSASCQLHVTVLQRDDIAELPQQAEAGSVVLFHGIAGEGLVMQYVARSFAELGLRVFIPDLPGHGHSPGPFSPQLAESCSASLLRGLAARGMLEPQHTILAGHSMGGAIALRVAYKFRPAGVIAISPAPTQTAHGVIRENLLYYDLPRLVPNTRILVAQFDLAAIRENAADLAASDPPIVFSVVPWTSHVTVLFSPAVAIACQAWAARVLGLPETTKLPYRTNLPACILGLLGIVLVAGPFIRDVVGKEPHDDLAVAPATPWWRAALEIIVVTLLAVYLFRYGQPLRMIHLFEGDYLASFFLVTGLALLAIHFRAASEQFRVSRGLLLGSALAGLLLQFLSSSWFELTAASAWLGVQRWLRFPLFFLAVFCFLFALELLIGPVKRAAIRYIFWLLLIALAWHSLAFGVLHLKTGQILLVLLSPYFLLLFVFAGLGIQLVRKLTGSPTAAAVFGAILVAGFCLAVFPVT